MKGTLNFSIDAVCEGYDWIDNHHISDKREWWVLVWVGSSRYRKESADTYDELRERVKKWWLLPLTEPKLSYYESIYLHRSTHEC